MMRTKFSTLALVAGLMTTPMVMAVADTTEAVATSAVATVADIKGPALLTDAGQGNTARMVEMMLARLDAVEISRDDLAPVDALTAEHGTLIIGVGASSKGLGAAGLDSNSEMARIRGLIEKAKAHNIPIVAVHIGGASRRGELSDTFNQLVAENATAIVVWNASDEDGFFKKIAADRGIHLVEVEQRPQSGQAIADLFKHEGGEG